LLREKEIEALNQMVERVTAVAAVAPARREFVERVTMLTTFVRDLCGAR
jgi:hypothetical protein